MTNSQGSYNTTTATLKDGSTGSNCGNSTSKHRWSNGQGVAGYAVSQSVSDVVSPQDIAFGTQVAETANLVASSILNRQNIKHDIKRWLNSSENTVKYALCEMCAILELIVLSRNSSYWTKCHRICTYQAITLNNRGHCIRDNEQKF
jgi:hypothetical protein